MEVLMKTSSVSIIEHGSQEENLLAAKRALKQNRKAHLMRHTGPGEDVIDIMVGSEVVERHKCSCVFSPVFIPNRQRRFCVEELALYQ